MRPDLSEGRPRVAVVIRSFGFPEGMAATNRIRLLGRALVEQGAQVCVLCLRVSERPGEVRTTSAAGKVHGIPFRYTTGTPLRDARFLVRRAVALRGFTVGLAELRRMRRAGRLDCVFLADGGGEPWSASVACLIWWLRLLRVPVVVELNEVPGTYGWAPSRWVPALSQLWGVDGVLAISEWLEQWAAREAERLRSRARILEVPIVVDTGEVTPGERVTDPPTFVYAASNEYLGDLAFVLQALRRVWERFPEARLEVTGMAPGRATAVVEGSALAGDAAGRVAVRGYLERPALLELYRRATALLIPLRDDLRSRARFPTKLGEYLASGAPVVTSRVGEVDRFLLDAEDAFIAEPGDPGAFAAKMIEVLEDARRAGAVGAAGRRVAEKHFSYHTQGARLRRFFAEVTAATSSRSGGESG